VIHVNQADAEVSDDEGKVQTTTPEDGSPVELRLGEGERRLTVTKDGFVTHSERVSVRLGETTTIRVQLSKVPKSPEPEPTPAPPTEPSDNRPPVFVTEPVSVVSVCRAKETERVPLVLSGWSVIQYELHDHPDADWKIHTGGTAVTQAVNADASIFLSDLEFSYARIRGKWRVDTSDDDDYIGFVFGCQDSQHFYLFDWKQDDQEDPLGFAKRGMNVRVVTADSFPTSRDLWPTAENRGRVRNLFHNTIGWRDYTDYEFILELQPDRFTITVLKGHTVLESVAIQDETFPTGRFGFYNYSQDNVVYQGFTSQATAEFSYNYDSDAVDPDGDRLTYSLTDHPEGMEIDEKSGLITWAPTSYESRTYDVTVQADDGRGGIARQAYAILGFDDHGSFQAEVQSVETRESRLRVWTDASGQHLMEAEFVCYTAGTVKLRKVDGEELTVPFERLSDADPAWIRRRGR